MIPSFLSRFFTVGLTTRMGITNSTTGGAVRGTPVTVPEGAEKATFAAGCFWGVEHLFRKHFRDNGLIDARVGYTGGDVSNPDYRRVCSGSTGHAEAVLLVFDPQQLPYKTLVEFFYKMHDPTTANRQGPDVGTQYRSGIFYHSDEQQKIAKEVTERVQKEWWTNGKIQTEILAAREWWDAEEYHQLYLDKNPSGYECPSHFVRNFK